MQADRGHWFLRLGGQGSLGSCPGSIAGVSHEVGCELGKWATLVLEGHLKRDNALGHLGVV